MSLGGEQSLLEQAIEAAGGPDAFAAMLAALPEDQQQQLAFEWPVLARPSQLPPAGDWDAWLLMAGRGFGKTRVGAETTRAEVEAGRARRIALVAPTAADARDVLVEGQSGILACSPPWCRPIYEPSKRRLVWPNGAQASIFSADEPDRLRGPQHDWAWCDELASYHDPQSVWDMLRLGLRIGARPRAVVTTTPRPIPLLRRLLEDRSVVVTRGSTYANAANLAPSFLETVRRSYEGTRLGRQELYAEVLSDNPNALFRQSDIDAARVTTAPDLKRVVVAVDPSATSDATSDECGIVVGGTAPCACRGTAETHLFVVADESAVLSPAAWAAAVRRAYDRHRADRVVAEKNMGGDMVEAVLRAHGGSHLPIRLVHASRGKQVRAEPISGLMEQRKIHLVGYFPRLEDQLTQWDPTASRSPDRLDSFVWLASDLMLKGTGLGTATVRTGPLRPRRDAKPPGWGWGGGR